MRLIDADELRKTIKERPAAISKGQLLLAKDGKWVDLLDNMPTVDAVEQKHGHWIAKSIGVSTVYEGHKFFKYVCSVCGREFSGYEFSPENMPYCHCGAKMDEVLENE